MAQILKLVALRIKDRFNLIISAENAISTPRAFETPNQENT